MNIIHKAALLGSFFIFNLASSTFPIDRIHLPQDSASIPVLLPDLENREKIILGVKQEEVVKEKDLIAVSERKLIPSGQGVATYYADYFHGRRTASGETFDMNAMTTAANLEYPFGTMLRVTNLENNKSVEVKVNDRGAFAVLGVTLDLSKAAFEAISPLSRGRIFINIEVIE